ncbi:MAG: alpha-amylase [Anaerolineae bacterium]|jgi:alpha-glucosidase|nr:alpha-amylase [Anaerolineae bacterium]MBT7074895.1 alpha-amylase [Anaerolineae bacterium]MBT7782095.1 alpha-amylase [Anaerolineae bacterium]
MKKDFLWWRDGIIYQIYPRSFNDINNNGLGDLAGITARLDYLADLGVDALWLSPFYPTPDADFGYDISNHIDVDPRFGSLQDFDDLLHASHERGIRIILDLVLNHVSNQHPWFQQSRVDSSNPKEDWFIWQDSIPNNWESVFGGKAWTYDEKREQYYYHMFVKEQPDVNWRNPEVRKAQMDVLRFWLERGVDGFRLDVFNVYFKDKELRNNPKKWGRRAFERQHHIYDGDQPEMESVLKEMRSIMNEYPDRYVVGETFFATREKIIRYNGADKLNAAFDFEFLWSKFKPKKFLKAIENWESLAEETQIFPNYVLSNHDSPRPATRYSKSEDDDRAKVIMAMLLTMRGTPFLYYGDEIGMRDISLKRSEIMDPPGIKYWPFNKGRDGCRSPMQWDDSVNAGFSKEKPWLPVHSNYEQRNVALQEKDEDSIFNFTRDLIALRKANKTLISGKIIIPSKMPYKIMSYIREDGDEKILVILNFSNRKRKIDLPVGESWHILFSKHEREGKAEKEMMLLPYEVLFLKNS